MSPINHASYLRTDAYRSMLDQMIAAYADHGHDLRTRLVEILGEHGVWPIACLEDRLDERRRLRGRDRKRNDHG